MTVRAKSTGSNATKLTQAQTHIRICSQLHRRGHCKVRPIRETVLNPC